MPTFDTDVLERGMKQNAWAIHRAPDSDSWVVELSRGRGAVEVVIAGDLATLTWGRIALNLAADDVDPTGTVMQVLEAMDGHGVVEIYGTDSIGHFGFIGYSIQFEGGSFLALDEDARELFRVVL